MFGMDATSHPAAAPGKFGEEVFLGGQLRRFQADGELGK